MMARSMSETRIRKLRREIGWSQTFVSSIADRHRRQVQRWESGDPQNKPPADYVALLEDVHKTLSLYRADHD